MRFKTVVLLALTCTSSAFACFPTNLQQIRQELSTYSLDCGHAYVGANLGVSHLHDQQTPATGASVDENGPGWNVNAGYQFNNILGAELGYTQYHDSRENAGQANVAYTEHYAAYLAATGHYPFVNKLSVLGKLGFAYSYANKVWPSLASQSSGAGSLYWGLGIDYSFTRTVDVVAQFARAVGNDYTGSADLYSIGFNLGIL